MLQKSAILLAFVLCIAVPGQAAILEVNCSPSPGQYADIQTAVNASSPGDTIVVEPCSTPYAGFSITFAQQLHVVGVEPSGAVPQGVGTNLVPGVVIKEPKGPCVAIDGSSGVSLQGFTLDFCSEEGVKAKNSESVVIQGNRIQNTKLSGIAVTGFNHSILGNYILYPTGHGIYLEEASLVQVSDNLIERAGEDGISVLGGWYVKLFNNNVIWSGNEGIELLDGDEHRVERNTAIYSGADDMLCNGTADPDFAANVYFGSFTDNCGADVYP